jgi:AraC-like DNA-binding protein
MSASALKARIFSSGVRAVYLGPAFDLAAHRTGVAVLCCAVSGSMEVARNPHHATSAWVACRTLFVPGGTLHRVRFQAEAIACVYLDPDSEDTARVSAAMCDKRGGVATCHNREDEVVSLFTAVVHDAIRPTDLQAKLVDVLGFATALPADERIGQVVARMRSTPGDAYPLKVLAAEVGLSPSRLQHLFKICTGLPLRRFRTWNRMGAAIVAAAAGASLTEAAHRAGFSSSAHFSTSFRAMFGLSPSELVDAGLEVFVAR